jgi:hypothetical protein
VGIELQSATVQPLNHVGLQFGKKEGEDRYFILRPIEQSNPCTGLERSWGLQKNEAPPFHYIRDMKLVRLSALHTGRLYPRKYFWYSFLLESK